jgi:hypothetical protein
MSENLRTTYPIARKKHDCNACDWIEPCLQDIFCELTFKEKRAISRMKNQKGKILPGQKYICSVGIWEGDFSVFKADIEMNDICVRLDLYVEY